MPLTFGEIRKIVAPYAANAGKCASSEEVARFAKDVMEYLLISGSHSALRTVKVQAVGSFLVLPPDVEIPVQAKIDGQVAHIWSKWFSYHSVEHCSPDCPPASNVMQETGELTPLAHPIPRCGTIVGIKSDCNEDPSSFVLVQGKDTEDRIVHTIHNGDKVPGEQFRIRKNEIGYGQIRWKEITGITKSRTNGYVSLWAVQPQSENTQLLAEWQPTEETPLYRRYRVTTRNCPPIAQISMLCRMRIRDNYHDNEVTFFDGRIPIIFAAQRLQSETNNDNQTAVTKTNALNDILEREAGYKKNQHGPMNVFFHTSGATIKNIV